ncbi:nitrilase-related carbon-nitrogen hydrolase (plasmid) [Agrobacterium leguminum]|uniref:nitrilase-related carbon-nitrogen hydrolase n=1 Tax=Agrobacterium leguminum TaxID=2792015 RepID=UPI00272B812B|nr:nitrilase-related carbon-nitrogen hydrolase [Agrobacterium leguminum]WLE00798.1 nitrilase-related carbon-nitrogen hydrolase [Agrobacterium leguminum]
MPSEDTTISVAVAQFASEADTDANIDRIAMLTASAAAKGARVVAFPEASSFAFMSSAAALASAAQSGSRSFRAAMGQIAKANGVDLVVGLYADGGSPLADNLLVVFGSDGQERGSYQKLHLFDAFHFRESEKSSFASLKDGFGELTVFDLGPFRFGLINCYDLRFPEIARALVDLGVNVLVVCAAWTMGPLKELHWETLLRARAIENTAYVMAAAQPAPVATGLSSILDPTGVILGTVPIGEGVVCATLSSCHLKRWRSMVPSLDHRRYAIAGRSATSQHTNNETIRGTEVCHSSS